jgi:hypothetical protein
MGFLDKAKEAANQAMVATQQAAAKGQDKVNSMQQGRTEAQLYAALGQAFYAEQRQSGPTKGVVDGLAALDQHFTEVARAADLQQQAHAAQQATYAPPASTPTPPAGAPPTGNPLDDI